jgi:hypothetical protein
MDSFLINDDYDDMNYRKEYLLKELKEYFLNDDFEVGYMSEWKDITPRQRIWLVDLLDMVFDFKYKLISQVNFNSELGKLKNENSKNIINSEEYCTKLNDLYKKYDIKNDTDDNEERGYHFPDECFDDCENKIKELCKNNNFDYFKINEIILNYLEKS